MLHSFVFLISALAGLLSHDANVSANERSEAREHFEKGTKAFELGAYDEAIAEYSAAYRLRDDPALLYNLAQANRAAGHSVEALRFYRLFLIKVPNTPNRAEVEDKITDLQKAAEPQKRPVEVAPQEPKPSVTVAAPEPPPSVAVTAPPQASQATEPSDSTATRPGNVKRIAGIAVGVIGVGAVVGGVVCGVLAQKAGDKLSQLDQSKQTFDYNQERSGKTDQLLEGVLLGVGAAAIVAGTVTFIVGQREKNRSRQVSIAPIAGANLAGILVNGRF